MNIDGKKFTCVGDEPYNEADYEFVKGSDWLMHEAFCLFGEADKFKPYEKHHSTDEEAVPACGAASDSKSCTLSYRGDTFEGAKRIIYCRGCAVLSWKSVCAG